MCPIWHMEQKVLRAWSRQLTGDSALAQETLSENKFEVIQADFGHVTKELIII